MKCLLSRFTSRPILIAILFTAGCLLPAASQVARPGFILAARILAMPGCSLRPWLGSTARRSLDGNRLRRTTTSAQSPALALLWRWLGLAWRFSSPPPSPVPHRWPRREPRVPCSWPRWGRFRHRLTPLALRAAADLVLSPLPCCWPLAHCPNDPSSDSAGSSHAPQTSPPNFDRLAGIYRWLEWLTFGPFLSLCRHAYLDRLNGRRRALIFGDGDGRFTAPFSAPIPNPDRGCRCQSCHAVATGPPRGLPRRSRKTCSTDARAWNPSRSEYDLVVSHFFLDCLSTQEIVPSQPGSGLAFCPTRSGSCRNSRSPPASTANSRRGPSSRSFIGHLGGSPDSKSAPSRTTAPLLARRASV